jgi:SAM-dependent methyltransferase
MSTTAVHRQAVTSSFATQATSLEDPAAHFGRADVLAWITDHTPTSPTDTVLEVAAGTALVARTLAPIVRHVVATDVTPEMLDLGRRAARDADLPNVAFQLADATALPFADDGFDRVACRLALHHVEEPASVLSEMVRVCRPGGTLTVIDMVAPDGPTGAVLNTLERLRDPSHTRALGASELHDAVAAGTRVVHRAARDQLLVAERWLAQTATPADVAADIRHRFEVELEGGEPTGLHPRRVAGGIEIVHRWELLVGQVPVEISQRASLTGPLPGS